MAIVLVAVLCTVILAVVVAVAAQRRRSAAPAAGCAGELDSLLQIYAGGGWRPPKERLVGVPESVEHQSQGWHAQQSVSRLYMPVGLRPTHRDAEPDD